MLVPSKAFTYARANLFPCFFRFVFHLFQTKNEQGGEQSSLRQAPVKLAQDLFALRSNALPFKLLGLGRSPGESAFREDIDPVIRELGPEMRNFGLQVTFTCPVPHLVLHDFSFIFFLWCVVGVVWCVGVVEGCAVLMEW